MTKIARKSRKIARKSNANEVKPAMLAIEFHATQETDAPESVESLVVVAPEDANEADVFSAYVYDLALNLRERVDFENNKQAYSCAEKYTNYARDIINERVAKVFFDARVVPDFCNRSERAGYRFNEKTTMRMRDIARFIVKADALTNYTRAIFASAYKFDQAGIAFDSSHAFACCSSNDRRHANVAHLMQHVEKVYGETTQQAQHSMSLNALVEMHALVETRTGKRSTYKVNPDSYVAQALIRELQLAA